MIEKTGAWSTDLANMMKSRQKENVGNTLGTVVSVKPLKISILRGQILLDSSVHEIYISNRLLDETLWKYEIDKSKNTTLIEGASRMFESRGELQFEEVLKDGDMVVVLPDESEQVFFITDVMVRV